MCVGFWAVEIAVPSPKFHFHPVGEFVLLSVNCTFSDTVPDVGDAEKAATGTADFAETVILVDVELEPFLLLAVKLTVYDPAFVN